MLLRIFSAQNAGPMHDGSHLRRQCLATTASTPRARRSQNADCLASRAHLADTAALGLRQSLSLPAHPPFASALRRWDECGQGVKRRPAGRTAMAAHLRCRSCTSGLLRICRALAIAPGISHVRARRGCIDGPASPRSPYDDRGWQPPRGRERFGRTGGRQEDPLEEASSRTAEPAAKAAEAEV